MRWLVAGIQRRGRLLAWLRVAVTVVAIDARRSFSAGISICGR
jgi:hypothetical protein